ncbi:MAG: transcriptional repressor NrdR [Firmicutes bacterium]|nr:transcriptional repressor NrdR [Candidatus Colimorpha enterica]
MKCPYCGYTESRVTDSRPSEDYAIRRRRECLKCKRRFTTYETYDTGSEDPIVVIKKDGSLQMFDRNKILTGMLQACYKRPVSRDRLNIAIDEIEKEISSRGSREITSTEIGNMVMKKLRELDEVSYVRFASVYREFKDVETFRKELDAMEH